MALIGYARTSTVDQEAGLEAQHRDLQAAGCEKIFSEQVSSVQERERLEAALDYVRDGDAFIVTKLDRLARSMTDLMRIRERLQTKGVTLRILSMNLDTSTPTGELMVNVMGSVAQFERSIMLERQREGIAKAKAEGKFRGRKQTPHQKIAEAISRVKNGEEVAIVCRDLGIHRATYYRHAGTSPQLGAPHG